MTGITPGAVPPPAADAGAGTGFCHLLGPPECGRTSEIDADPVIAHRVLGALFDLLSVKAAVGDNPGIPAGCTYLFQFLAHDMVDSTIPMWRAAATGTTSRNRRDRALRLEALYGGGPEGSPDLFAPATDGAAPALLRLGRTVAAEIPGPPPPSCPFRDVARDAEPAGPNGASRPRLADPRNDEGLVLSQLVVLLAHLHNAFVARLDPADGGSRFALARTALLHVYHAVIRGELMPMLLNCSVCDRIAARDLDSPDWLLTDAAMPLEFSHGALRIGHAMVRHAYPFNALKVLNTGQVLSGPSWSHGVRARLPLDWVAQWSAFFPVESGRKPTRAKRFAARVPQTLDIVRIPDSRADDPRSMSLRDWLGASHARMTRLDVLLAALQPRWPDAEWLTVADVRDWLGELVATANGLAEAKAAIGDLDALARNLPLPLYVLLEAEKRGGGHRLGPLGSIIVAEVVFRRLAEAERDVRRELPDARTAFGADWERIARVACMPDVVRLAAEWGGLDACSPIPFI